MTKAREIAARLFPATMDFISGKSDVDSNAGHRAAAEFGINEALEWAAQLCQAEADASNNLIRSTACLDCAELIREGKSVSAETKP